jgi:hypothetical protein
MQKARGPLVKISFFLHIAGFKPVQITGSTKYGETGNCGKNFLEKLDIPQEVRNNLGKWGNMGLTQGTWSTYRTAERLWLTCMKDSRRKGELPAKEADVAVFVNWLIEKRGVKAGTINGYLSGLRQLHIVKGMEPPVIRSASMNLVLKGKKNSENIESRRGEGISR